MARVHFILSLVALTSAGPLNATAQAGGDEACLLSGLVASDSQSIQAGADRDIANFMAMKPVMRRSVPDSVYDHVNALAKDCAKRLRWSDEAEGRVVDYAIDRLYFEAVEHNLARRGVSKAKLDDAWRALTPQDLADLELPQAPDALVRRVMAILDRVDAPKGGVRPLILMYLGFRHDVARSEARLAFR